MLNMKCWEKIIKIVVDVIRECAYSYIHQQRPTGNQRRSKWIAVRKRLPSAAIMEKPIVALFFLVDFSLPAAHAPAHRMVN